MEAVQAGIRATGSDEILGVNKIRQAIDTLVLKKRLAILESSNPLHNKFYKPDTQPAMQAALGTDPFRIFADFAIYPLWTIAPTDNPEGGTRVDLHDERFPFAATAILDRSNHVVSSSLHL